MALAPVLGDILDKRLALEDTNTHVVITARDDRRYVLLRRAADGRHLSSSASDGQEGSAALLRCVDLVDDSAVWSAVEGGFQHPVTGAIVAAEAGGSTQDGRPSVSLQLRESAGGSLVSTRFAVEHGPESLPSEYLTTLEDQGIVCMPSLLAPALVAELQALAAAQVAAEDAGEPEPPPLVLRSAAAARCCANPVALFVIRSYMKTDDVMQAHYPGFAVLRPNDGTGTQGAEGPGGWHRCARPTLTLIGSELTIWCRSDWPYSPGVLHEYLESTGSYPKDLPLGLQVNWCITDFTPSVDTAHLICLHNDSLRVSCLQAEWRYVFRAGLEGRAAPTAAGVGAADGAFHLRGAGGDAVHRPGGNGDHLRLKVRPLTLAVQL